LKSLNYYARFIELAGEINSHMPEYVVERIGLLMNDKFARSINKSSILVLGVAYKKDIKDVRESPALDVIQLLENKGAKIVYSDPHVPEIEWNASKHASKKLTPELVKKMDLTVILTNHTKFDYQWVVDHSKAVFDTRNATKQVTRNRDRIFRL
jgi:UDP-N-acetyl-D-glucosamine dehydrogenase